ncbi:MAG: hydroxyacid dehydrogenase [Actinobacteria bacterium]|nr:hydroxyacid dehydrogenase [Actinomycetota bacterium]
MEGQPRVVVGPVPGPDWVRAAVEAGGGVIVEPAEAEAVVWGGPPNDVDGLKSLVRAAKDARWVQLPWAGVEFYVAAGVFDHDHVWTCGKGVYAEEVAEHALALALAGLRDLPDRIRATSWAKQSGISLYDGRVTILGGGGITEALLPLLAPMRVDVTVVRRSPQPMPGATRTVCVFDDDGESPRERVHQTLVGADVVFLALALTPETTGIIDAAALDAMESHAWLINVARGQHVVTDDLVDALRRRTIGGAGLDVTDPEPLPDGHPLWDLPNCIITPHTANTAEMARPVLTARITENVRRFGAGEPLIGPVDPHLGY